MEYLIVVLFFTAIIFIYKWLREKKAHKITWKNHLKALNSIKEIK